MNFPLLITTAGMEFSLFSAFIWMLLIPAWGLSFPVYESILGFSLAAAVIYITRSRGWFVIQVFLLHLLGLIITLCLFLKKYYYPHASIFRIDLALNAFAQIRGTEEAFYLIAVIISTLVIYTGGANYARRPGEYNVVSERFDKGIAYYALIFFIEEVAIKTGSGPGLWLALYFLFSIMAIGIARGAGEAEKEFISGYSKIGLITGFLLITFLIVTVVFIFGLPYLTGAADTGYSVIKYVTRPFFPLVVAILKFLFGRRSVASHGSYSSSGGGGIGPVEEQSNWLIALLEKIAGHLLMVIGVLMAVILMGLFLRYLIYWLFSKTDNKRGRLNIKGYLGSIISSLKRILAKLSYRDDTGRVVKIYKKLCRWGKIGGLEKLSAETPREYQERLSTNFPFVDREIKILVELYNRKAYGCDPITGKEVERARICWRKIRSPRYWFYLFKFRIL